MSPGRTYFVTTKTWEDRSLFQETEIADIVVGVMLRHRLSGAYLLHEFVLMPDHLDLLLTPGPATTLQKAIQLIKGGSSYEIHKRQSGRLIVWHPGFHEWTIRDAQDFQERAASIRQSPVVAKLAEKPEEWPHSSARERFELDGRPDGFAAEAGTSVSIRRKPLAN